MATSKSTSPRLTLKVTKAPNEALALTNNVFVNASDFDSLHVAPPPNNYVKIKQYIFNIQGVQAIDRGTIGLSSVQRRFLNLAFNEEVVVKPYQPRKPNVYLSSLKLEVDYLVKKAGRNDTFEASELEETLKRKFMHQFFTVGQQFVADVNAINLLFTVVAVEVADLASLGNDTSDAPQSQSTSTAKRGILMKQTQFTFDKPQGSGIKIQGSTGAANPSLFRHDFNFETLGIGGLDKEFAAIFRRAFASRVFPSSVVKKLGIQHVKGVLLYGPPGTGKTLMARQIGKMLNAREPKIVNGPEILNKYVGQSEENIRNLFKDAEIEYRERGDDSDLHIIIFDELDAICRARGSGSTGGTGVGDSVVNQLLAKMDGVERLNNILVIGMTNRKELIDEALLRPGRLEVHMEIGLPDEHGRLQILRIHTNSAAKNGLLGSDVDLAELAALTKNFSGAEIEGLVKSAASFAMNRQIDATNPTSPLNPDNIRLTRADFLAALQEVKPAFGVNEETLETCMANGIIDFGPAFRKVLATCKMFIEQVKNSDRTPLVSVLLDGPNGSGKTALAAKVATESGFPYIKVISPEDLVGYTEGAKCMKITKVFEDAYKSPLSLVIVDDIERLLDYVRIGPRFSNVVLQTLLVLFKKHPPKGKKLLIIGTTSSRDVLEDMEFMSSFDAVVPLPLVRGSEVKTVLRESGGFSEADLEKISALCSNTPIPIKKLIMVAEMAKQGNSGSLVDRFEMCLQDYGAIQQKARSVDSHF